MTRESGGPTRRQVRTKYESLRRMPAGKGKSVLR